MKQYTADNLNKYFTFDDKVQPDAESLTKLIAIANLSDQDRESITKMQRDSWNRFDRQNRFIDGTFPCGVWPINQRRDRADVPR